MRQDIKCVLNVQHNCWDSKCQITHTKSHTVERTLVHQGRPEVSHRPVNSYIINAAALYSAEQHWEASGLQWGAVCQEEWKDGVTSGLERWLTSHPIPVPPVPEVG